MYYPADISDTTIKKGAPWFLRCVGRKFRVYHSANMEDALDLSKNIYADLPSSQVAIIVIGEKHQSNIVIRLSHLVTLANYLFIYYPAQGNHCPQFTQSYSRRCRYLFTPMLLCSILAMQTHTSKTHKSLSPLSGLWSSSLMALEELALCIGLIIYLLYSMASLKFY